MERFKSPELDVPAPRAFRRSLPTSLRQPDNSLSQTRLLLFTKKLQAMTDRLMNDRLLSHPLAIFLLLTPFGLLGIGLLGAGPAAAQPTWTQGTWTEATSGRPQVSLDWTKPSFDGDTESTSLLTSRLVLSGQYPIGETTRLVADLPISRFGIDDEGAGRADGVSSTKIGNPYLGAYARLSGGWAVGGGARLPLTSAPEDPDTGEEFRQNAADVLALATGSLADMSRVEAFGAETFTARGYGEYTLRSAGGLAARLRSGLSLLVPTEDTDLRENVVLLDYGGRAWYDGNRFRVGLGIGGRTNLNADETETFNERSIYFFDSAVQAQFGQVRPGLTLRVPLGGEPSELLDFAAGINVTVAL